MDFYLKKLNLVEVDGESHDSDEARLKGGKLQLALEKLGLSFLRFDDFDVKNKIEMVLEKIGELIEKFENTNPSARPNPPAPPLQAGQFK